MLFTGRILLAVSFWLLIISLMSISLIAQSSDQNFPTAVTSNEIVGKILPRAIGDSRITTYFYQFSGEQGDIFVNVVTTHFTGDIDIYTADRMQPLTKIVVYASDSANETGRLIYLRKPERLILRVNGRPPGDEAATFRIKFGGSFVASKEATPDDAPRVSQESLANDSGIVVNSAGTIVETRPRKTDEVEEEEVSAADRPSRTVIESTKPKETEREAVLRSIREERRARTASPATQDPPVRSARQVPESPADVKAEPKEARSEAEPAPNPLASIRLVILLKNGTIVEHSMDKIRSFGYDKGRLNVIPISGRTLRYSILAIERVTIQ